MRPAADSTSAAGRRMRCLVASESFGVMASQEAGRAGISSAIVVVRSVGSGLGRLGGAWRVLHEDRGLLGKVWVYSMRRGDSGSTHNPWPVHPYPCGVGRPERARVGAGVESVPLGPCAGADEAGGVRICREDPGPGYASGPVSTQRTSVSPPSMSPAGILGVLRFWLGLWEPARC